MPGQLNDQHDSGNRSMGGGGEHAAAMPAPAPQATSSRRWVKRLPSPIRQLNFRNFQRSLDFRQRIDIEDLADVKRSMCVRQNSRTSKRPSL
jgi:hypothetical protein